METGPVRSCPMIYHPLVKKQPRSVGRPRNLISLCFVTKINQEMGTDLFLLVPIFEYCIYFHVIIKWQDVRITKCL